MALTNSKPTENRESQRKEDLSVPTQNGGSNGHSSAPLTKQSSNNQPAEFTKYPPGLIAAYQELALKELDECLSVDEQARLQSLRNQIYEIDRQDPGFKVMQQYLDALEAELKDMRRQAEALPNAK